MAAARSCFICSLNLDGNNPQFNGSCNYKAVFVMCQVLEIPKSEIMAIRSTLEQASFCSECMETFQDIETINKIITEKAIVLQAKLKKHCEERRQEQEGSGRPFGPLDELRDKIVRELKSTVRMTILTKPLGARFGQGHTLPMSDQKGIKDVVNVQGQSPGPTVCEEVSSLDQGQGILQPGTTLPDQGQPESVVPTSSRIADHAAVVSSGAQEKGRTVPMMSNNSAPHSSLGLGLGVLLGTEVPHTNCTRGNTMGSSRQNLHNLEPLEKVITNSFLSSARGSFGHGTSVPGSVKREVTPVNRNWRSGYRSDSESDKFQGDTIPFSWFSEAIRKRISDSVSTPKTPIVITLEDSDDSGNEGTGTSTRASSAQSSTSQISNTNASQDSTVGSGTVSLEAPQTVLTLNSRSQVVEPVPSVPHSSGTGSTAGFQLSTSIFAPPPPNLQFGDKRQSVNQVQGNKRFRRCLSTDETVRVLQYMAESVTKGELEKPNGNVYYTGLITALKIPFCSPAIIKSRIYNVRLNYIKFRRERERVLSTPQPPTGVRFLSQAQIESNTLFQYSRAVWGDDLDISNAQAQMDDVLNNTI